MHPKEPRLEELLAGSEPKAARFVTLLLGLIGAALAILGGFNYLVDPFSSYGSPMNLERPRPVRLVKLDRLREADPPPEALILGSSRVRVIAPEGVERSFGLKAFHAGGLKGSPQNWLSVTRYAVDERGYPIRLVILGVDPSSFVDVTSYLQHPANIPELRRHLRFPRYSQFRSWVHLWSPRQTKASMALLMTGSRQIGPDDANPFLVDANGFARHFLPLDAVDITKTAVSLHRAQGVVEREHIDDFEALVRFASARRITIVAYVTPQAPALTRALSRTHYPQTLVATRSILQDAIPKGLILCEVDSLGLQKSDFVDPHHPTLEAGNRILESLHRCAREEGFD